MFRRHLAYPTDRRVSPTVRLEHSEVVTDIRLRPALPAEAPAISELALRSKSHWGYSAEFLDSVRGELTIPPELCDGVRVVIAERDGALLGFHRLSGEPPEGALESLFLDLPAIGTGVGRLLFHDAADRARQLGLSSLVIDADPGAEPFYLHMGAERIGETPSGSIPGRFLPQLRFVL